MSGHVNVYERLLVILRLTIVDVLVNMKVANSLIMEIIERLTGDH